MTTTDNPNLIPFLPEKCPHKKFHATVHVEEDTYRVHVEVMCKQCGQAMTFPGIGPKYTIQGTYL